MSSSELPDHTAEDQPYGDLEVVPAEGTDLAADPSLVPLTSEFGGGKELAMSPIMNPPNENTDQAGIVPFNPEPLPSGQAGSGTL